MPTALPAVTGDVFHLTEDLLASGLEAAHASPRRRIILPIHRSQDALVQRMFNFMLPGTYVQPHLHPREDAIETMMVLLFELCVGLFDDQGNYSQGTQNGLFSFCAKHRFQYFLTLSIQYVNELFSSFQKAFPP